LFRSSRSRLLFTLSAISSTIMMVSLVLMHNLIILTCRVAGEVMQFGMEIAEAGKPTPASGGG